MLITNYMRDEHRACDDLFANAEKEVIEGNFEKAMELFVRFSEETLKHFEKEEEILFPLFEDITGSKEGPTNVMRYEHEQVRELIGQMAGAAEDKNKDAYLSVSESLMILLQQHNMKEEQMLYAMCDRVIPADKKDQSIQKMKQK